MAAGRVGRRAMSQSADKHAVHRPTDPGTRLRVLASDAVRPVPGREPPAHAPGRRGRQPGGVRGTGRIGAGTERLRPGGSLRQHGCCRRSSAPTTCCWRSSSPRSSGWRWRSCWLDLPARDVSRRRQPRLGLPVLADEEEGGGQQERREDRRTHPAGRDAALHRGLHGAVPAAQHHRGVVVCPARHPGATGRRGRAGGKCPVRLDYLRWAPAPAPVAKPSSAGSSVAQPPSAGLESDQEPQPGALCHIPQLLSAQPPPAGLGSTDQETQPGAAVPHSPGLMTSVAQPPSAGPSVAGSGIDWGKTTPAKPTKSEYRRNLPHLQVEGKTYDGGRSALTTAGRCWRVNPVPWSSSIAFTTMARNCTCTRS